MKQTDQLILFHPHCRRPVRGRIVQIDAFDPSSLSSCYTSVLDLCDGFGLVQWFWTCASVLDLCDGFSLVQRRSALRELSLPFPFCLLLVCVFVVVVWCLSVPHLPRSPPSAWSLCFRIGDGGSVRLRPYLHREVSLECRWSS